MAKTEKSLSQQRREALQKGADIIDHSKTVYDEDFEPKELGTLNLRYLHFEEGLTVKDLKELLKNEDDRNIFQIYPEGVGVNPTNIVDVIAPEMQNPKGEVVKNETSLSIRFCYKPAETVGKDAAVQWKCDADAAKLRHNPSLAPYFSEQLKLIKDRDLREFVTLYIDHQPRFKMEYPTSSTGKYHPEWQNGEGGNGRHTKNVVKILQVFERAYPNLKWDEVYAAAILHDMSKYSDSSDEYTNPEHPIIESNKFKEYHRQVLESTTAKTGMGYTHTWSFKRKIKFICHLIKWHDGRFNCTFANKEQIKHNYTKGLTGKMKYAEAYLLHLADMVSANKSLWEDMF